MATYLMAVPLAPGKTEIWKKYNQELDGPRRQDYINERKKLGIRVEQVALQQTPDGDFVIVHWEADNAQKVFDTFNNPQNEFEKWFHDKILIECHNYDSSQPWPKMTIVHDYHETPSRDYATTGKKA